MAHYAKVTDGIVQKVLVAEAEFFDNFVDDSPGEWIQTSYNTRGNVHYTPNGDDPDGGIALRKNYAGIGYHYDGVGFYAPQPFSSWTLNSSTYLWEPPTALPDDGKLYNWNETNKTWDEVEDTRSSQENNMPFIGEQPAEAATLKVVARSATVTVELTAGTIVVTTRSGTVSVGVE